MDLNSPTCRDQLESSGEIDSHSHSVARLDIFYIENIIISSLHLFGSHMRRQARDLCESTEKFATQFIVGLDKLTID